MAGDVLSLDLDEAEIPRPGQHAFALLDGDGRAAPGEEGDRHAMAGEDLVRALADGPVAFCRRAESVDAEVRSRGRHAHGTERARYPGPDRWRAVPPETLGPDVSSKPRSGSPSQFTT